MNRNYSRRNSHCSIAGKEGWLWMCSNTDSVMVKLLPPFLSLLGKGHWCCLLRHHESQESAFGWTCYYFSQIFFISKGTKSKSNYFKSMKYDFFFNSKLGYIMAICTADSVKIQETQIFCLLKVVKQGRYVKYPQKLFSFIKITHEHQ